MNKLLKNKINAVRKSITTASPCIGTVDLVDRLFRFPRNSHPPGDIFLKRDPYAFWTDMIFEGIEMQLLLFDIMIFCLFYGQTSGNAVLAMLATYMVQKTYDYIRHEEGMRNVFKTSMLSEKFGL